MRYLLFIIFVVVFTGYVFSQNNQPAFRNTSLPVDERVNDLLHQLSLKEKISLLGYQSKAIERLGIPAYNWWNEVLRGVSGASNAIVFPQAIGMAALYYFC